MLDQFPDHFVGAAEQRESVWADLILQG